MWFILCCYIVVLPHVVHSMVLYVVLPHVVHSMVLYVVLPTCGSFYAAICSVAHVWFIRWCYGRRQKKVSVS